MSVISKCLVSSKYAANAATTEYTAASGMRTIIDKFTGYNGTAGSVSLSVNIVPSGSTAAASNLKVVKSVSTGETYTFPELVGQVLNPGDFLSVVCSAANSIVIRVSGREVT